PHQADATFCTECGSRLLPVPSVSELLTSVEGVRPPPDDKQVSLATSRASTPASTQADLTPTPTPRTRQAERRSVTILYCNHNLSESVDLIEMLDSGERDLLLGRWQQLCEEAVERYQGTVLTSAGSGLMVCFGYPVAFEDAAYRAVQAGLRILKG